MSPETAGFGASCMAHAACVRIHRGLMPSQITRYRKFSTTRFGFLYLVYLVIASRSIRRLVYDTSRTARLRSRQYVSMALRSGVAVGRKIISRPSVLSTSSRIFVALCWEALSMIRQIFLNLYAACIKKSAKACWLNLSYCLNIPLPSVVIRP